MERVAAFYQNYDEIDRLSRSRSRELELITTMHFIDEYAKRGKTAIDLGSGPGAYTLSLAPRMKHVVAVDITEKHIQELEERAKSKGLDNISAFCKSALEVEASDVGEFDVVLCLGPYYHYRRRIMKTILVWIVSSTLASILIQNSLRKRQQLRVLRLSSILESMAHGTSFLKS